MPNYCNSVIVSHGYNADELLSGSCTCVDIECVVELRIKWWIIWLISQLVCDLCNSLIRLPSTHLSSDAAPLGVLVLATVYQLWTLTYYHPLLFFFFKLARRHLAIINTATQSNTFISLGVNAKCSKFTSSSQTVVRLLFDAVRMNHTSRVCGRISWTLL